MATAATQYPAPPAVAAATTTATATAAPSSSSAHQQRTSQRGSSKHHSSSRSAEQYDRFYGHRELSELCEQVIMALFSCPLDSAASSVSQQQQANGGRAAPRLGEFIAYALHRTRLPLAVTHQALFLLKRLKSRFPAARGSSGHRLFISALMLASKSSCDDTYSNKSWTVVGQGLFTLREVNQMERELFGYLGYKVNVENEELEIFVDGLNQGKIVDTVSTMPPPAQSSPVQTGADDADSTSSSHDVDDEADVDDEEDNSDGELPSQHDIDEEHSVSPSTSLDEDDDDDAEDAKVADDMSVSPTTKPRQYSRSHQGHAAVAIPAHGQSHHHQQQQQQQQHHHQHQHQHQQTLRDVYHQQAAAVSAPNVYSAGLARSASMSGYSFPTTRNQSYTMPAQTASLDAHQQQQQQQQQAAAMAAAASAAASYQQSYASSSSRGSISSLSGYSLASGSMTPSPSHTGSSSCTSPETPASELTGSPCWTGQEARVRRSSSNSSAHIDGHFAPLSKYSEQYARQPAYPQQQQQQQQQPQQPQQHERAAQEAAAAYRHQQQQYQQHQHQHQAAYAAASQHQRPFGIHPDWQ